MGAPIQLPPTSPDLERDEVVPYFLWWTHLTVGEFRWRIAGGDRDSRAYWLGALLREAHTRDVWCFVRPEQIRDLWPELTRHLGRKRDMWAFLLGMPAPVWPPREAYRG